MRLAMASLPSPMCGRLAIVDNDGNGATGDKVNNDGDGATGNFDGYYDGDGMTGYNADVDDDNATDDEVSNNGDGTTRHLV